MCELFAVCAANPVDVTGSLQELARHDPQDGWGIAWYEDRDIHLLREAGPAQESFWLSCAWRERRRSPIVLAHLRQATRGEASLANTQPFHRELAGRVHVFAHNGHLDAPERALPLHRFLPVGTTDSEVAFCYLLEQLAALWEGFRGLPEPNLRFEVVAEVAERLRHLGVANFLYSDGDALFVHSHRRTQSDGGVRPPGLHVLEGWPCSSCGAQEAAAVLVSTFPLCPQEWRPMAEDEILMIRRASVVSAPE